MSKLKNLLFFLVGCFSLFPLSLLNAADRMDEVLSIQRDHFQKEIAREEDLIHLKNQYIFVAYTRFFAKEKALEDCLHSPFRLSSSDLYRYALQLQDGKISDFKNAKPAAILCFRHVFLNEIQDKVLWGKTANKLGLFYYDQRNYQRALGLFQVAALTGLPEAGRNVQEIKKFLPSKEQISQRLVGYLEEKRRQFCRQALALVREAHRMDAINEEFELQNLIYGCRRLFQRDGKEPLPLDTIKANFHNSPSYIQHQEYLQSLDKDFLSRTNNFLIPFKKVEERAQRTAITVADIDQIYYDYLESYDFILPEIRQWLFTYPTLRENDELASKLKECLNPSTLPIFIGRSTEWILQHFRYHFPEQPFLKLAGSELSLIYHYDEQLQPAIPLELRKSYGEYLLSFNLSNAVFEDRRYTSVTLIDRVESGDSLFAVATLLHQLDERFDLFKDTIKLLGIVSAEDQDKFLFPTLLVSSQVFTETANKHAWDQAQSLSRPFNPPQWPLWQTFNFNLLPLAPAQARLQQLENYLKRNLNDSPYG